jgi:hypothetical protein
MTVGQGKIQSRHVDYEENCETSIKRRLSRTLKIVWGMQSADGALLCCRHHAYDIAYRDGGEPVPAMPGPPKPVADAVCSNGWLGKAWGRRVTAEDKHDARPHDDCDYQAADGASGDDRGASAPGYRTSSLPALQKSELGDGFALMPCPITR